MKPTETQMGELEERTQQFSAQVLDVYKELRLHAINEQLMGEVVRAMWLGWSQAGNNQTPNANHQKTNHQ